MNIMMNRHSNPNLMDPLAADTTRKSSTGNSVMKMNSSSYSNNSTMSSMNENDQAILLKTMIQSANSSNNNEHAPSNAINVSVTNTNTNGNSNVMMNGTTTEFTEVLEARIRRKSQNLKDLVANFWVPPNGNNKTTKSGNEPSIEALKMKLLTRKESEEMFGMFHPVDAIDTNNNKNNASANANTTTTCTTTQNSKWLDALEGARKSSSITGTGTSITGTGTGTTGNTIAKLFPSIDNILAIEKQLFQSTTSNNIIINSINNYNTIIPPTNNTALQLSAKAYAAASSLTTTSFDNGSNGGGGIGGLGGLGIGIGNNIMLPPHIPTRTPNTSYLTCSTNHFSTMSVVTQPSPYDIVCGRNSGAYNYIGNRRFRVTVDMHLQRYIESPTREDKTNVIKSIVWMLHEDIGARFLKKTIIKKKDIKTGRTHNKGGTPRYEIMNEKQAREKVGHALRDLVIQARKVTFPKQQKQKQPKPKQTLQQKLEHQMKDV